MTDGAIPRANGERRERAPKGEETERGTERRRKKENGGRGRASALIYQSGL